MAAVPTKCDQGSGQSNTAFVCLCVWCADSQTNYSNGQTARNWLSHLRSLAFRAQAALHSGSIRSTPQTNIRFEAKPDTQFWEFPAVGRVLCLARSFGVCRYSACAAICSIQLTRLRRVVNVATDLMLFASAVVRIPARQRKCSSAINTDSGFCGAPHV